MTEKRGDDWVLSIVSSMEYPRVLLEQVLQASDACMIVWPHIPIPLITVTSDCLPKALDSMILAFDLQAAVLNQHLKEKDFEDKEIQEALNEVVSIGNKVRNRRRQLRN